MNSRLDLIANAFGTKRETLLSESPMAVPPKFIKTHYHGIDDLVLRGGLPRGAKIELVAPPSEGKTTIVMKLAESVILGGGAVGWADTENVQRFVNFGKEYTGFRIPLIQPINEETGQLALDIDGSPWMVPDPEHFYIFDHTDGEDLRKKIFTFLALDIFDLIVIDSIGAVDVDRNVDADITGKSQYDKYQTAVFWNEFFLKLDNGFKAERYSSKANKGEGGFIPIKNIKTRHGFVEKGTGKKTSYTLDDETHKLCDKKTCMLFINHLKEKIEMNRFIKSHLQTQTSGGRGKEFLCDIRIILSALNKYSGSGKTKVYQGKDIIMMNEKSRIGKPYGKTTLFLSTNGTLTDHNGQVDPETFFQIGYDSSKFADEVENFNEIIEVLEGRNEETPKATSIPISTTTEGIDA